MIRPLAILAGHEARLPHAGAPPALQHILRSDVATQRYRR